MGSAQTKPSDSACSGAGPALCGFGGLKRNSLNSHESNTHTSGDARGAQASKSAADLKSEWQVGIASLRELSLLFFYFFFLFILSVIFNLRLLDFSALLTPPFPCWIQLRFDRFCIFSSWACGAGILCGLSLIQFLSSCFYSI